MLTQAAGRGGGYLLHATVNAIIIIMRGMSILFWQIEKICICQKRPFNSMTVAVSVFFFRWTRWKKNKNVFGRLQMGIIQVFFLHPYYGGNTWASNSPFKPELWCTPTWGLGVAAIIHCHYTASCRHHTFSVNNLFRSRSCTGPILIDSTTAQYSGPVWQQPT